MSYIPLARRYRPSHFSELLGQTGVSLALGNAIKIGREPHTIIFSGIRGVGKTTTARLYARALNCAKGPTPEPCGVCHSCEAIAAGVHEDVVEIDGASHTGVDDIRNIQETMSYAPRRSRFKIYIIDEVHMLSQSAFNALLKTLEEPPENVVFVFATTELHKVPDTIVSRCQAFQLRKLKNETIVANISRILVNENIEYESAAIEAIAREGQGSMRDALTLLDQVIAIGEGRVDMTALEQIVATVSTEFCWKLIRALLQRDAEATLDWIGQVDQSGSDLPRVLEELLLSVRDGMVLKLGSDQKYLLSLGISESDRQTVEECLRSVDMVDLNRLFRTLKQCLRELDGSDIDRFVFENCCLEWCCDPGIPSLEDWQQLAKGVIPSQPGLAQSATSTKKPATVNKLSAFVEDQKKNTSTATRSVAPKQLPSGWRDLVTKFKEESPILARNVEAARPIKFSDSEIVLIVDQDSLASSLAKTDVQEKLKAQLTEFFNFSGRLSIQIEEKKDAHPQSVLEVRQEESENERQNIRKRVVEDPLTQALLAKTRGKIVDVTVTKPGLI